MSNKLSIPSSTGAGYADDLEERKPWRVCLAATGIFMLLICFLAGGTFVGFRWYVTWDMSSSEVAEMRRFITEPVDFPADWARADPYEPSLLAAETDLAKIWETRNPIITRHLRGSGHVDGEDVLKKAANGETLSGEERTTLSLLVSDTQSFVEECSRTVALAGYESGISLPGANVLLSYVVAAKASCAKAHLLAAEQQWEDAFDYALLPLRRAQRHPASTITNHLVAISAQVIGLRSMATLAENCPDPQLLRRTLEDLNQMRDRLNPNVLEQFDLIDCVGQLRSYQRGGYPVDLAPGKPRMHYMNQTLDATSTFPQAGSQLSAMKMTGFPLGLRAMQTLFPEMLYRIGRPNYQDAPIREKVAQVHYDLTRILLARRILEREGKDCPAAVSELVPEFSAKEPMDPFSGASFLWDGVNRFYSVGPDLVDDMLGELYDPTNGTVSRGDLTVWH